MKATDDSRRAANTVATTTQAEPQLQAVDARLFKEALRLAHEWHPRQRRLTEEEYRQHWGPK